MKVCLLDGASGRGVAHACYPDREMTIDAPKPGWAEQAPETWWECAKRATERLLEGADIAARDIRAIGISYQMHGLVLLDRDGRVVRPSIIWCDSRAVDVGARALDALGGTRCLEALLNAPGNFTASKLAWVRENEPAHFERAHTMMLPGDISRGGSRAAPLRRSRVFRRASSGISRSTKRPDFFSSTSLFRRRSSLMWSRPSASKADSRKPPPWSSG